MTRRRWIADEFSDNHAALTGPHAEHLAVVLRARVGQVFEIVAGDDPRMGRITAVGRERIEFELGEVLAQASAPRITLLMSVFKFDRMEWAIEKCTELGVERIIPMIARRTEAHLGQAAAKRVERWRRIAQQAAEQSRRIAPASVDTPIKLNLAATQMNAATQIVLSENERHLSLKDALAAHSAAEELILAFGPEGGWTEEELQLFAKSGWASASLGPSILRAETAAIAATAIAFSELS
jgi:16S rRNA (uracil1498-N3)-methyltransferase